MSAILSMRLRRLERSIALADPYAHLSDDELAARIDELDREIEAATGMTPRAYARMLDARIRSREPLPDGLSDADGTRFVIAVHGADAWRLAYVQ